MYGTAHRITESNQHMAKHKETNGDQAVADAAEARDVGNTIGMNDPALAEIIPKRFVKTQIGFPPYWRCEVGKAFRGIVLLRDERVPNFVRYHIQTSTRLDCQIGPVDNGEVVTVQPGEIFTLSAYAALPLERLFGFEVAVLVKGSRKLPGNDDSGGMPRDLFEFEVFVDPEDEKRLISQRKEDQQYLRDAHAKARKLALDNMIQMMMSPKPKQSFAPSNT